MYDDENRIVLRDYQEEAVESLRDGLRGGHKWQMLVAPTGAGKTVMAGAIIQSASAKQSRVGFIVDRIALVSQTSLRMHEAGIRHGVKQGDVDIGADEPVRVYSAQTLERMRRPPKFDLAIYDEAHTKRRRTIEMLQAMDCPVIGLTASPFTSGLGGLYKRVVNARTTNQLIGEGHLVPPRTFIARPVARVDMTGVMPNSMGEWNASDVEQRAMCVVGDIVAEWVRHVMRVFGRPVKTLVFSATINDGAEYVRQFQALGYRFEQVTHADSSVDRDRKISQFRAGDLQGLVSCEALAKGFDVADVLCLIGGRAYRKSFASLIQQVGRGMRPSPGKEYFLYLDHTYPSNWDRFAEPLERFWSEGCKGLDDASIKETLERKPETANWECARCGYYRKPGEWKCSQCGFEHERSKRSQTRHLNGQLVEYQDLFKNHGDVWQDICYLAVERHPADPVRALKFARIQHKEITGKWPFAKLLTPGKQCDPYVRKIVTARYRKWLRDKRKEQKRTAS